MYISNVWMYMCAVAFVEVREQPWEFSSLLLSSLIAGLNSGYGFNGIQWHPVILLALDLNFIYL